MVAQALAEDTGTSVEQAQGRLSRYEQTYRAMAPWLPTGEVRDFLDIGCGLGGVAMWVARHYPEARAHLIDGEGWGEKYVYQDDGRPWADVGLALKLWAKHCPGREVRAWPPDPELTIPCELIYSNCSWGHHYPIRTYLALVRRSLRPGGTLIVDLRVGKVGDEGRAELAAHLRKVATLEPVKKYARTVWMRP